MKIFYFDIETTGLDATRHGIVQIAYIMERDGDIQYQGNLHVRPFPDDTIDDAAMVIHGYDRARIASFTNPRIAYSLLLSTLDLFIDKYDKTDKAYPCAFNGAFDLGFLLRFFQRNDNQYLFSYINTRLIDPLALFRYMDFQGKIGLQSYSMISLCNHFDIPLTAHDAMSDIIATRALLQKIGDIL